MRSENEILEKIRAYIALAHQCDMGKPTDPLPEKFYYAASVLEWVLSEPKEEPLTAIELSELREIMKVWKENIRPTSDGGLSFGAGRPLYPFPGN
jgi:hypothetical protein